jgi:3-hydroxyacyl-CoA dehydrogenase
MFVAGADIKHLERMSNDGVVHSILPQIIRDIESAPKPIVAAIDGSALGGGLEIAIGAHSRIASPNAKLGQPEVKLGLIPGAGGTQRLARLAAVEAAREMCVFGEPVRAEEATRLGIIDRIAEGDLFPAAIQYAKEMIGAAPRRTRDVSDKLGTRESCALMFTAYRERVRKTRKNLPAPAT